MMLDDLSHEDKRSWRLNEAALAHACQNWERAAPIIARNIERLEQERRIAPGYIARCKELFAAGPQVMRNAFLDLTDEGQALRSVHPFAGLLLRDERNRILRETRPDPR